VRESKHAVEPGANNTGPCFDFLGLPRELRNIVYDRLWRLRNIVGAYHTSTKTGVLAYYDGTVLNESEVTTEYAMHGDYRKRESEKWRPNATVGLPMWLLTSKLIMHEGIEQFRL
jgi:hypothetical protein